MPRAAKLAFRRQTWRLGALLVGAAVAVLSIAAAYFSLPKAQQSARAAFSGTGSIVITSADYNDCRHLTFDNVTGSIKDVGVRKCSEDSNDQRGSLSEISKGFR
jgi:hypothetical protein